MPNEHVSFMYKVNKTGPSIEPWGTPVVIPENPIDDLLQLLLEFFLQDHFKTIYMHLTQSQ